ncbi:MAG: ATP-binding cassette domain-containing protein [Nitrospiraceae bacterium]|nr:ATP-binding cassette domain-containing protein [Nitrospiraceae bacterium]
MISLHDVRVSYGALEALRGVTCSIESGAVGLLGPNGAGKSTLLKTLLGFVRAKQGDVRVFGESMPKSAVKVRQRLGYMPEREVVSPKLSAVGFLTYCGCLLGMSRVDAMERAHEVLNYVGVGESRYRKMETYSMGMRQRIKFAQALTHDPKLLLLDEPTSGLDPEGRVEMLDLIGELARRRKVTVLLSTHLLPDVEHVCDRVLMIDKGRVVLDAKIVDAGARGGVRGARARQKRGFRACGEGGGVRAVRPIDGQYPGDETAGQEGGGVV